MSCELLAKLGLEDFDRILRAGLGMWSVPVLRSEQRVIYRLVAGGGKEAQASMEETDGERLT